jgi:hypothetical protein
MAHPVSAVLYALIASFSAVVAALIVAWLFVTEPSVICCVYADIAELKWVFAFWIHVDCVGEDCAMTGDSVRILDDCCMLLTLLFESEVLLLLEAEVAGVDGVLVVVHTPFVQVFT